MGASPPAGISLAVGEDYFVGEDDCSGDYGAGGICSYSRGDKGCGKTSAARCQAFGGIFAEVEFVIIITSSHGGHRLDPTQPKWTNRGTCSLLLPINIAYHNVMTNSALLHLNKPSSGYSNSSGCPDCRVMGVLSMERVNGL